MAATAGLRRGLTLLALAIFTDFLALRGRLSLICCCRCRFAGLGGLCGFRLDLLLLLSVRCGLDGLGCRVDIGMLPC